MVTVEHFASCLSSPLLMVSVLLVRFVLYLCSISMLFGSLRLALGAGGVHCSPCLVVLSPDVLQFTYTFVGPSDISPPTFLVVIILSCKLRPSFGDFGCALQPVSISVEPERAPVSFHAHD